MAAADDLPSAAPRSGGRARRSAETRAALIRLGLERFPIRGYDATSIDDIVRGSGISRPTWYLHFGDKAEFFMAVLVARGAPRGAWWEMARDPSLGSLAETLARVRAGLAAADPLFVEWNLLRMEFLRAERGNPEVAPAFAALHDGYLDELEHFFEVLRERGFMPPGGDTRQMAAALLAIVGGLRTNAWLYGADPEIDPALLAALLTVR